MLEQIFMHFGIILLPILLYQVWAGRKSFVKLPAATPVMGVYGGLCAIFSEVFPIHLFGLGADLKCIPLILSFLYGKRRAGAISFAMAAAFRLFVAHFSWSAWLAVATMAAYCAYPYWICNRFDAFRASIRILHAIFGSIGVVVVQVLGIVLYYRIQAAAPQQMLMTYSHFLTVLFVLQTGLLLLAVLVLDNIVDSGRVRATLIESQAALENSEKQYRSLVDYNPIAICAVNTSARFTGVNKSFEDLTGYTEEELIGSHYLDLWFPEDYDLAGRIVGDRTDVDIRKNIEVTLRHKSGRRIHARVTRVPIIVDGHVIGHYTLVSDQTTTLVAERLIRKSEMLSAVGHMAAGIAHEIRNPLTSLKGFLKLVQSETSRHSEYFDIMETELDRIEQFSGELMVLAKAQYENYRTVDLNGLLKQVVSFFESQAIVKRVEIRCHLDAPRPTVFGDAHQLKQVVINILRNAIDAMPGGGRVTVSSLLAEEGNVSIRIQDNGMGMSEETLRRVGEPFYTTKGSGTGLGLMVSHRIIERHGGKIAYESALGRGTTVTIGLPLTRARTQAMDSGA